MHTNLRLFLILIFCSSVITAQKDSLSVRKLVPNTNQLNELREQLDDYFNDPNFSNAISGVLIKSVRTGEVLYKRNADKLFIPASNMKLFTSAAGLVLLGANYVYETTLSVDGELSKGALDGNLIIQGSGDPTISGRFYDGDITKVFENWADTLKARGIWVIKGNIIGDDSLFDNEGLGRGWELEHESDWYAAPSGALSFNDNTIEVRITPTQPNFPAKVELVPNTKFASVISKVVTVSDGTEEPLKVTRVRGTNLINVTGDISVDSEPVSNHLSIADPTMYFLTVLKEVLEKKGIVVKGQVESIDNVDKTINPDDLTPVLVHRSVPLKMILRELNKNSNNFYAEQLLKTIGSEIYNYGTIENGVKACKDLFNTMGINSDNLVMADGSGLSRLDLVTPRQIVDLLSYMYKSDFYNDFYDSLPIAGVDGTLINRMKRSLAEGNVHAKAGYNTNVSSLSGYLKTVSGEPLIFSIIINNFLTPPTLANYIEDNVCIRLVNFNRN